MSIVNVARFLPERACELPNACALKVPLDDFDGQSGSIAYLERTFKELNSDADAAAHYFQHQGISRGMRALLLVSPGLDLLRCVFALFKLGAIPVLLDPGMGLKNFLSCVQHSAPEALVAVAKAHWIARFFPRKFATLKIRIRVGGRGWESELLAHRSAASFPIASTESRDLAAILFTSGSTGAPKGVCYEHGMFEGQVNLIRNRFGMEMGEVDLPLLPIFALFNPALGMTTVVPEINPSRPATCDASRLIMAIRQNRVTNSFGSPALWWRVVRHCETAKLDLPSLKRVLVAGAPVHPELLRRLQKLLPNGTVHVPYGATESLPVSSISSAEVSKETWTLTEQGRGTCVGTLFPGMEVRILPVINGPITSMSESTALSAGQIGEIAVRGPVVTRSYDRLPEATAFAKIPDPTLADSLAVWHRMGDLGYQDERGRLWFCGRVAERVETTAGIYHTECIEAVFNCHSRVARSAFIGLNSRPSQVPALVVEPAPGFFPKSKAEQSKFVDELLAIAVNARPLCGRGEQTASLPMPAMAGIYFRRSLPVDVRHNAKIHRLTLSREYTRKR